MLRWSLQPPPSGYTPYHLQWTLHVAYNSHIPLRHRRQWYPPLKSHGVTNRKTIISRDIPARTQSLNKLPHLQFKWVKSKKKKPSESLIFWQYKASTLSTQWTQTRTPTYIKSFSIPSRIECWWNDLLHCVSLYRFIWLYTLHASHSRISPHPSACYGPLVLSPPNYFISFKPVMLCSCRLRMRKYVSAALVPAWNGWNCWAAVPD
jgi:hypothetical protein